jgi:hypothetical protein
MQERSSKQHFGLPLQFSAYSHATIVDFGLQEQNHRQILGLKVSTPHSTVKVQKKY